ncbi:MAG: hypothetical protein ACFFAE_17255 [Candidatus Hodarchaeota archaeon]
MYSCNICGRPLIKEEVDKSIIKRRSVPGKDTKTEDLYHSLMGSEGGIKTKKRWWQRAGKRVTSLSSYEQSQISELCDVEGLTIPLILEFSTGFKIDNLSHYQDRKEKRDLLFRLAHEDPIFLSFLFSSLIELDSIPGAFELRFAVFCSSQFPGRIKKATPRESTGDEGYDFRIIETTGNETWVYSLEENMDIDNLEKLANRAFNINFKEYPNLKRVFLAAKSFSYLTKGLISKYQTVLTGIDSPVNESSKETWQSIPLLLWQPMPGKIDFQNVSLE